MIRIELGSGQRPFVRLQRLPSANDGAWSRLQEAMQRGVIGGNALRIDVRLDVFFAELDVVRSISRNYEQKIEFGELIRTQLRILVEDRRTRESYVAQSDQLVSDLGPELREAGFSRTLKPFQIRNLAKIMRLPHGADFSVPGAGKTTVALANFALNRHSGLVKRALVVAPLSAFSAWIEDSKECFESAPLHVVVHSGSDSMIPDRTEILITNYHRVASDYDRIRQYVGEIPTQIFLDEAHRIKGGGGKVHGRAVLDLAYAARRRDVLTGTPAPQGAYDLVALMQFLYPGQDGQILPAATYLERNGRTAEVVQATGKAIERYFVRTTKVELSLPKTEFVVERQVMGVLQQAIYDALIGRFRSTFQVSRTSKVEFNRLGRIVMYLLEAATNPMLLMAGSDKDDAYEFAHPPLEVSGDENLLELLRNYGSYETPWKYTRIFEIVQEAAKNNQKVLIWSNFVRNLKGLYRHLQVFNPALIHGGISASEQPGQPGGSARAIQLEKFRNDTSCSVLLANPATLSEGVSLHHTCHHAVYIDRTFNAGHFLQSQDRIHRLGLGENIITKYTLLLSEGSIDESVDARLFEKIDALASLMGDPGLVKLALPGTDEENEEGAGIFSDDVAALKSHFEGI